MLDDEFPTGSLPYVDVDAYGYESDSDLEEINEFSKPISSKGLKLHVPDSDSHTPEHDSQSARCAISFSTHQSSLKPS